MRPVVFAVIVLSTMVLLDGVVQKNAEIFKRERNIKTIFHGKRF
jgi:hypothetical protein